MRLSLVTLQLVGADRQSRPELGRKAGGIDDSLPQRRRPFTCTCSAKTLVTSRRKLLGFKPGFKEKYMLLRCKHSEEVVIWISTGTVLTAALCMPLSLHFDVPRIVAHQQQTAWISARVAAACLLLLADLESCRNLSPYHSLALLYKSYSQSARLGSTCHFQIAQEWSALG